MRNGEGFTKYVREVCLLQRAWILAEYLENPNAGFSMFNFFSVNEKKSGASQRRGAQT